MDGEGGREGGKKNVRSEKVPALFIKRAYSLASAARPRGRIRIERGEGRAIEQRYAVSVVRSNS